MANETSVSASINNSKNGISISVSASKTIDMSGDAAIENVQNVGTTTEALVVGDVTAPGYIFVKNLDATNYVELALATPATTQVFCKLLAGQFALFPAKTATIYALANTAACNVAVALVSV